MIEISKSQEASAPIEKVWQLVGDLENEQKYWAELRDVKILRKKDNLTIVREATIRRGPMGDATSFQTLSIDPIQKSSTLTMTEGPMLGSRKIMLSSIEGGKKTKIDVSWQFELKGIPGFAQGFVKDNVSEVTEKALETIAEESKSRK